MQKTIQLSNWRHDHVAALTRLANNKKIWDQVRDYFPHPYSRKNATHWISTHGANKADMHFAIEIDGALAGAISLQPKEDIYRLTAELGYWIGEPYWGQGIATKAIGLILDLCSEKNPEIIRIYAEVFADNIASARALERNGFFLESVRKNAVVKNNKVGDDQVWVKFLGNRIETR